MTDQKSPLDAALDVLVYAPVGLALTAAEEIPKLAEKGRARVTGQLAAAKLVGQFVVAQGRKEIERRLGSTGGPGPGGREGTGAHAGPAAEPEEPEVGPDPSFDEMLGGTRDETGRSEVVESAPGGISNGAGSDGSGAGGTVVPAVTDVPTVMDAPAVVDVPAAPAVADPGPAASLVPPPSSVPNADGLAIPGYDSLSASQVVQRLAGLAPDELAAVGAYESTHRGRRTILTRVSQLQAG